MDQKTTEELLHVLQNTSTVSELEEFTREMDDVSTFQSFHEYFSFLLKQKQLSSAEVILASLIQRNYGYQILSGAKKPSRDKVISLCLAAHLNLDETKRCLTLAGHNVLYPKIRRDSILIFAVDKEMTVLDTNELLDEMKEDILS